MGRETIDLNRLTWEVRRSMVTRLRLSKGNAIQRVREFTVDGCDWIVLFAHVLRRIRREQSRLVSVWRNTIYRDRAFSRMTHLSDSLYTVCLPTSPLPHLSFHSLLSSSWNFLILSTLCVHVSLFFVARDIFRYRRIVIGHASINSSWQFYAIWRDYTTNIVAERWELLRLKVKKILEKMWMDITL